MTVEGTSLSTAVSRLGVADTVTEVYLLGDEVARAWTRPSNSLCLKTWSSSSISPYTFMMWSLDTETTLPLTLKLCVLSTDMNVKFLMFSG